MADINTIYAPAIDEMDPDVIIGELPGTWPWSPTRKIYFPDEYKVKIREFNAEAVSTANAVKIPFTGIDKPQRIVWVTERINAVNLRFQFVKQRTFQLLEKLQASDQQAYNALLKSFSTAISAVPIVGSVVSSIVGADQAAQKLDQYKQQVLIKDYQADAEQLVKIRQALVSEFQGVPSATGGINFDPTSNAPASNTSKYIIIGIGLLFLFFIIMKNRNS